MKCKRCVFKKGHNWNDLPIKYKRGRLILKEEYEKNEAIRTRWVSIDPPTFTEDNEFLNRLF